MKESINLAYGARSNAAKTTSHLDSKQSPLDEIDPSLLQSKADELWASFACYDFYFLFSNLVELVRKQEKIKEESYQKLRSVEVSVNHDRQVLHTSDLDIRIQSIYQEERKAYMVQSRLLVDLRAFLLDPNFSNLCLKLIQSKSYVQERKRLLASLYEYAKHNFQNNLFKAKIVKILSRDHNILNVVLNYPAKKIANLIYNIDYKNKLLQSARKPVNDRLYDLEATVMLIQHSFLGRNRDSSMNKYINFLCEKFKDTQNLRLWEIFYRIDNPELQKVKLSFLIKEQIMIVNTAGCIKNLNFLYELIALNYSKEIIDLNTIEFRNSCLEFVSAASKFVNSISSGWQGVINDLQVKIDEIRILIIGLDLDVNQSQSEANMSIDAPRV